MENSLQAYMSNHLIGISIYITHYHIRPHQAVSKFGEVLTDNIGYFLRKIDFRMDLFEME